MLNGYTLDGELNERITAVIYLIISIHVSYAFYIEIIKFSASTIEKIFFVMIVIILLGAFAEVYLGLSSITEWFRENFLIGYQQSDYSDVRDNIVYGRYRARFFTAEPSHLAISLLMFSLVWLTFSKNRFKFILYGLVNLIGLKLIMSPILFVALPSAIIIYYYEGNRRLSTKNILIAVFGIILIFLLGYMLKDYFHMTERINVILEGADDSALMRLFAPPLIALKLLSKSIFFGYGISGINSQVRTTSDVLYLIGIRDSVIALERVTTNIYNSFWSFWISFGLLIGLLQIYILKNVLARNQIHMYSYFFIIVILYSFTTSNINSIRFWTLFFIIMLTQYGLLGRIRDREIDQHSSKKIR
jgi:hypothetical protein